MSATGRGGQRIMHDNYPTPAWATRRFVERAELRGIPLHGRFLEPMAGEGAIIRAIDSTAPRVPGAAFGRVWTACELRTECLPSLRPLCRKVYGGDVFGRVDRLADKMLPAGESFDVAITNPSFRLAIQALQLMLSLAPWAIMLARLGILESEERHPLIAANVPDVYVLPNRPPFALNSDGKVGADATAYAWMVWGPHSRGATRGSVELLDLTPLEERQRHMEMLRTGQSLASRVA